MAVKTLIGEFNKINQVAKNLVKSSLYAVIDNKTIITTTFGNNETSKISMMKFDNEVEALNVIKHRAINGKEFYDIGKQKLESFGDITNDYIEVNTKKNGCMVMNNSHMKYSLILRKIRRFPSFDQIEIFESDITDDALNIYNDKSILNKSYKGVNVYITKKMLAGYKKGNEVNLKIYNVMECDYLYVLELQIRRDDLKCNILNNFLIMNY